MEKEIEILGKKIVVKEITYLDSIEIADLKEKEGLKSAIKKQIEMATGLIPEEIETLSLKDGVLIQKIVNEVNSSDIVDFQEPIEEKAN